MFDVRTSEPFKKWLKRLKDLKGRMAITRRLERLEHGHLGDVKPIDSEITEMRFAIGPGYRVYFARSGARIVILLVGGDKSTQTRDIEKAKNLWKEIRHEYDHTDDL